ncbi:hypothetical protein SCOCK_60238 [Actinacidiphila cocklensis]|uniref:Uncharacterized protein n=1 Tax=Actinacidiphila cocklensis TaxID=887465 RepID=A0A9W4EAX0_9ACTN|nr:hypothetical protein SCOCK_60238 [Actinacidiphila cocklensis]
MTHMAGGSLPSRCRQTGLQTVMSMCATIKEAAVRRPDRRGRDHPAGHPPRGHGEPRLGTGSHVTRSRKGRPAGAPAPLPDRVSLGIPLPRAAEDSEGGANSGDCRRGQQIRRQLYGPGRLPCHGAYRGLHVQFLVQEGGRL